jgi:hypothetical protein
MVYGVFKENGNINGDIIMNKYFSEVQPVKKYLRILK